MPLKPILLVTGNHLGGWQDMGIAGAYEAGPISTYGVE